MFRICLIYAFALLLFNDGNAQSVKTDSLTHLLKRAKNDSVKIELLNELTWSYAYSDIETALQYGEQNLKLAKLSGDPTKESNAYRALGVVFMNSGNNYKALDLFLKAYKKAEESRDVVLQGRAFNALGGIHSYEGNYKKSIDYFLKALQSSEISGDERLQLAATVSIGIAYLSVDVDSALYYTNKGLQMANRMKVSSSQAIATNNLGEINLFMNNYSLAMEYYRLAAPRFVQIENDDGLIGAYLGMAHVFDKLRQPDSSLHYARKALSLSKAGNFIPRIYNVTQFLSSFYKERGNTDSAYFYQSEMLVANDSLFNQDKANQFWSLSFDESIRQQDLELANLQKEKERRINIQYAGIAIGIIIIITAFLVLTNSVFINERWVHFLGILVLLLVFEFINLVFHSYIAEITHHSPVWMLLILTIIASLLIPLHHKIEHWVSKKVVAKNRRLRIAAAKKILTELKEGESSLQ